jgi:hypothetical protein
LKARRPWRKLRRAFAVVWLRERLLARADYTCREGILPTQGSPASPLLQSALLANARLPGYTAASPSSSSILKSWFNAGNPGWEVSLDNTYVYGVQYHA